MPQPLFVRGFTAHARALVLAGALLLAPLLASRPAYANCGAEGCPLAPQGYEHVPGNFSFDVSYQYINQNRLWDGSREHSAEAEGEEEHDADHPTEELTRTKSLLMNGRYSPTDWLSLVLSVPYIQREHRHTLEHHAGYFITSDWKFEGLADATVMSHVRLPHQVAPWGGAFVVQLGAKLPTGERHIEVIDDEEAEPPVRLGTGSTDLFTGIRYGRTFNVSRLDHAEGSLPFTIGVLARTNGKGTDGYRMGNELEGYVTGSYPLVSRLELLGQVNATTHGRDEVGDTDAEPHHTGGSAVFLTPGLRYSPFDRLGVFAYYQVRVYQHTNGPQLIAPYHLLFGTSWQLIH